LPPVYENGSVTTISTQVVGGKISVSDPIIQTDPWKSWYDNVGFMVTDIKITNGGSGYTLPPVVVIKDMEQ